MTPSLENLLLVMAVAFAAPLILGLFPRLQLPSVVLEIVAGVAIGSWVVGVAGRGRGVRGAVLLVVRGAERSMRIRADLLRLQDTTAQIRVRAALVLFVGFAAIADALGLEAILGAFRSEEHTSEL